MRFSEYLFETLEREYKAVRAELDRWSTYVWDYLIDQGIGELIPATDTDQSTYKAMSKDHTPVGEIMGPDDDTTFWLWIKDTPENQEKIAYIKRGFEREAVLIQKYQKLKKELEDNRKGNLTEWVENEDFTRLWDKYVPIEGKADTPKGEAIRALGRLEYDYYNNGYGNVYDWNGRTLDPMFKELIHHLRTYVRQHHGPIEATKIFSKARPTYYLERVNGKHDPHNPQVIYRRRKQEKEFRDAVQVLKNWFVSNSYDSEFIQ